MNHDDSLLVGIDVAAHTLTAAWGPSIPEIGPAHTFDQKPVEYKRLIGILNETGCQANHVRVIIEATGSYWIQVARHLYEADFRVQVINPKQAYATLKLTYNKPRPMRLMRACWLKWRRA